jgi:hypothetical protein
MMLNGDRQTRTGEWTRVGSEGTTSFLHLLGKGVITPPRREQLQAVSAVALVMQQPSERFIHHGSNGHHEEGWGGDGTDAQPWPFDRLDAYWAMAPLPPTDVATYLWHRTRRDASHVPVTAPHGFVCLVPGAITGPSGPWSSLWTTDGDTLARDGKRCSLDEARRLLEQDLVAGEKRFPFQVEGRVFHQVVRQSPGRYVIALVDPGWLDPADRDIVIRTQLPGAWTASDRLTGQPLGTIQNGLEITVPAGAIRLLQLQGDTP